jgi:branched-chain amino acid transport system permease protein
MEKLAQQLINGLSLGSMYGLIAIGYTMVFGIIGMVNFAHGDIFMLSSFIALILLIALQQFLAIDSFALSFAIVMLTGMALTGLWAAVTEKIAYRRLAGSFRLAPLISAIGMSLVLSNFVYIVQGPNSKSAPFAMLPGEIKLTEGRAFDVTISYKQILIMATTAVLLAVFWFIVQKTALGRAQRACEQDAKMAALLGVDVNRTISATFVIGAALAAVAGLLFLVQYNSIQYTDGFVPGVKAFAAAVLGGIGSLPGAVLGGLLIGLVEILWGFYVSGQYKDVAAFSVLAITLIFMPSGLLGKPEVEKV